MTRAVEQAPHLDLDFYSDDALLDPYPLYRELREAGPVAWIPALSCFALGRFAEVRAASMDHTVYSSAAGVVVNEQVNEMVAGNTLTSDAPMHTVMRGIVGRPLRPTAVRELTDTMAAEAGTLVDTLVARGTFDGVADFSWHLPLTVVRNLVGVSASAAERMPRWSTSAFDLSGPATERTPAAQAMVGEMIGYTMSPGLRGELLPGGWGAQLFDAVDSGEIVEPQARSMLSDYLGPSLDTTMSATASMLWLLATHPDQYALLRERPELIDSAILEALRLEAPIPSFTRRTTTDVEVGGVPLPAGSRVILWYASANRDERQWPDPERFDVARNPVQQLSFGMGPHVCVGLHLAKLEMRCLLRAMVDKVASIEIGELVREPNSGLRSIATMPVTFS